METINVSILRRIYEPIVTIPIILQSGNEIEVETEIEILVHPDVISSERPSS